MRQTPMLAQRLHGTAPFNWFGSAESLPKNIHNTVGRMGGSGINEAQTESLVAFLTGEEGLVPPPNPFVNPEGLTASQLAGKQLFYHPSIGCADCHTGESLTDGENWDVGTFNSIEFDLNAANGTGEALALNTPSLRGLHYSAPYFHDGSAEDLYDVLNSTAETMGVTIQLTSTQQDDLVAYLLTL